MTQIRLAKLGDAEIIPAVEARAPQTPGPLVSWPCEIALQTYRDKLAKLRQHGGCVVGEQSGEVIGHAFLDPMPTPANAHVFQVTIVMHPAHTGGGRYGVDSQTPMIGR
ncbi:MAG TPA: hypothetical protein VJS89_04560 [Gammaproteobacteria bacterium]|nr:hypothetical protein [Gammaproteobacteria bacterium]